MLTHGLILYGDGVVNTEPTLLAKSVLKMSLGSAAVIAGFREVQSAAVYGKERQSCDSARRLAKGLRKDYPQQDVAANLRMAYYDLIDVWRVLKCGDVADYIDETVGSRILSLNGDCFVPEAVDPGFEAKLDEANRLFANASRVVASYGPLRFIPSYRNRLNAIVTSENSGLALFHRKNAAEPWCAEFREIAGGLR